MTDDYNLADEDTCFSFQDIKLFADIFLDFSTVVDVDFRINYHQIIIEINRFIGILRDKIFCTAADKVSFDFHKGIVVNELNKLVDDIGAYCLQ